MQAMPDRVPTASEHPSGRPSARGELALAISTLILAAVVLWQAFTIPVTPIYARVGPTWAPILAGLALGICGLLLLVSALRGGWQPQDERDFTPDRTALGWVLAGLALNVITIGPLGFTLASILLFVCVARGFGSRQIVRDALIAAAFALTAYIGFAKALNINIGAGLIENAIEAGFALLQRR